MSHHPPQPPHLHALFIHCLRLSTGPSETRGVRGLTYGAPAGGRQFKWPRRSPQPESEGPASRPTCASHRFRVGAGYPPFAILICESAAGRRGRASSVRSFSLPAQRSAGDREEPGPT